MKKLGVDGDLEPLLDRFVETLEVGRFFANLDEDIHAVFDRPYLVRISGDQVGRSSQTFLEGPVDVLRFGAVVGKDPLPRSSNFLDWLVFSDIGADLDASELFPGGSNGNGSGRFDADRLNTFLSAGDWDIAGGPAADTIAPGPRMTLTGNDILRGNEGNDSLNGASGDDQLFGGAGDDKMFGGRGVDRLLGNQGSDHLLGSAGSDRLIGGNGRDRLEGGRHGDWLDGGSARDVLNGDQGKDTLIGGRGSDSMSGGSGADRFVFNGRIDEGRDRIFDFTPGFDTLELRDIDPESVSFGKQGGNLLVELEFGTIIVLQNVAPGKFEMDDLVFA